MTQTDSHDTMTVTDSHDSMTYDIRLLTKEIVVGYCHSIDTSADG